MRRTALRIGTALLFLAVMGLRAQINRGVIEGVVTDPPGAVVAGVDVTISAIDTNVSMSIRTNSTGYYRVVDLVPGKYRARFEFSGFTPLDINDIEVSAGRLIRVDAQLRLETTRQILEVQARAPLVEEGASNFGSTLETRIIQDVPMAGRDLQQLVFLIPGVNNVGGPPGSNFGFTSQYGTFPDPTNVLGSNISVNGGQAGANAWYLDGNLNLSGFAENIVVNPSPDAALEFQGITSAFAAEYGRTGGAVFSVVLKSGTNSLHGNAYEFNRNDAFNARNPFTSIDQTGLIKDRQLRFNNFGGTLGGPLVVPHLYNGKDRTFFFLSWDETRLHLLGNKTFTVPTARMRQGDFSEDPSVTSSGLWNPYSTVGPDPSSGLFQRQAFGTPVPGNPYGANGCLNASVEAGSAAGITTCNFSLQIPRQMLDPVAMFFIKSFPLPNYNNPLSGCPMGLDGFKICSNYLGAVGSSQNPHNISLKFDHAWSEKNRYFVEWLYNPGAYRNYRVPWTGPTFPQDSVGWGSNYPVDFDNQIIGLGNTYMIRPSLINEFRVSFSRQYMTTHPQHPYPDSITDQTEVQKVLAPTRIPLDPLFPVPNWQVYGPGGGLLPFGPTAWVNMNMMAEAFTILDNISKVRGKHTFKTGVVYRKDRGAYESGVPTGLAFYGAGVQDPSTGLGGSGLAEFMLGALNSGSYSYTGRIDMPYIRWAYWGLYAQDDYRITSNFTLNFGLRYDLFGSYRSRRWPRFNFCFQCLNPLTGLRGLVLHSGDPGYPPGDILPSNTDSLAPRLNFAWTPFKNRKLVIRGGYDIFYTNAFNSLNAPGQSAINGSSAAPGYFGTWAGSFYPKDCASLTGNCVAWPLSDTSTDKGAILVPPADLKPKDPKDPLLGKSAYAFIRPKRDPMVQMWSLQIQRELPGHIVIDLGYVGSHGTHLVGEPFANYNYVHTKDKLKYKTAINSVIPITDVFSGLTAQKLTEAYKTDSLPRSFLLDDYPFFQYVYTNSNFNGTSIYHGMNLRVEKQYSMGLNFVAAYTVGKKINNWATGNAAAMTVDPIHWSRNGNLGGRAGVLSWNGGFGGVYQDPDNKKLDRAIAADDIPQMLNIASTYELPFGSGKPLLNHKGVVNSVVGGWRLTGNFNAQGGLPLPISGPCDQVTCRPDLIGDPHFKGNRSKAQRIAQWLNPAAFMPAFGNDPNFWANYDPNDDRAYLFGTAGPRLGNARSPGFWNVDTALAKPFHLTEQRYLEFRWEVFNALNHQNLGFPNTNYCLPPNADGSTDKVHQAGCQFGRITNIQTDPRAMQFALKFYW